MSRSLRSMQKDERKTAIDRRLKSETKGLGYWAAIDAAVKIKINSAKSTEETC